MSRSFAGLLAFGLAFGVTCRAPVPTVRVSPSAAGPPASWLAPLELRSGIQHWHVTIRGVRDSADRSFGDKVVSQTLMAPAEADEVLIASVWRPPLTSIDSLVIAPDGLRPMHEILAFNGFTRRYQYEGNRVWGTVQHADSAPRSVDHTFPERVFAFSEVDLLIRAVPFRPSWTIVVPLFSEGDEDVEHDTITVVSPTTAPGHRGSADAWVVRFADPAIVSTYVVLARSREIISVDTQQRRTSAVLRFRATLTNAPG